MPSVSGIYIGKGKNGQDRWKQAYKCEAVKGCNEKFPTPDEARAHEREHRIEQGKESGCVNIDRRM